MSFQVIRRPIRPRSNGHSRPASGIADDASWRCAGCARLLGILRDGQLHIRFARGHEYIAALPTSCICRQCGALNRTPVPSR